VCGWFTHVLQVASFKIVSVVYPHSAVVLLGLVVGLPLFFAFLLKEDLVFSSAFQSEAFVFFYYFKA
jgi:hypothetical protein